MTTLESNRCYACAKLFCCADCCTEHIRKKHPGRESKCPLCRSELLMVKNFDNQEFLCHVVFNHLPLHCRLCGEVFKSCDELNALGACNHHRLIRKASAIQSEANKSLLSPETPSPLNKTPSSQLGAKREKFSIGGDYNGNFSSFTSPPELYRNTSTPMHVNLPGNANFAFKTPRSPIYTFKTPKATISVKNARRNERSGIKENSVQNDVNSNTTESPTSESIYFSLSSLSKSSIADSRTPLRSILSNQSAIPENSQQELSRNSARKFSAMQDINEEMGIEQNQSDDMDLTGVMSNIIAEDCANGAAYENVSQRPIKELRDSVKRVRFSDQFEIKSESTPRNSLNASENDEFFEARQSISEISVAIVDKLSTSQALINRENERNLEKEETARAVVMKSPEINDSKKQNPAQNSPTTSSSSSTVVMMVVVEKNGRVNPTDLAPLIDSSLKKLENVVSPSSSPGANSGASQLLADKNGSSGNTVVSVDRYMSVSTVERYSTPNSTFNDPQSPSNSLESSNSGTGGIFSAMAHAMRSAFRNFSGASSSRSISRELVSQKDNSGSGISSNADSSASSSVLTSLATALVPRPAKRSRDMDELPAPQTTEVAEPQNDIRSPLPKRPCGWYKIRAREPIARMRNNSVTSPRGVSSETQCFQQGSLSIGDTILPLPSRAHQATQTD